MEIPNIISFLQSHQFIIGYVAGLITIFSFFKAKLKFVNSFRIARINRKISQYSTMMEHVTDEEIDDFGKIFHEFGPMIMDLKRIKEDSPSLKDYNSTINSIYRIIDLELDYYYKLSDNIPRSDANRLNEIRERIDNLLFQLYETKLNSIDSRDNNSAILGLHQMARQKNYGEEAFDLLVNRVGSKPEPEFGMKMVILERIKKLCKELYC